jgi:hypothetical protein
VSQVVDIDPTLEREWILLGWARYMLVGVLLLEKTAAFAAPLVLLVWQDLLAAEDHLLKKIYLIVSIEVPLSDHEPTFQEEVSKLRNVVTFPILHTDL